MVTVLTHNAVDWDEGVTFEHLGPKPVTLHSREELDRACKERGMESDYLENTSHSCGRVKYRLVYDKEKDEVVEVPA